MQLHKLCKYALELEWSGGRRGGAEVEGVRGGQRWVEKGEGRSYHDRTNKTLHCSSVNLVDLMLR